MKAEQTMTKKKLLLLGGGHSHALLIRSLIAKPIPEIEILLVSVGSSTPYSGMLPSTLAGHSNWEAMQIDLERLTGAAGLVFYQAEALEIDLKGARVKLCGSGPQWLSYDFLSINVGGETQRPAFGISVKPLDKFLAQWNRLLTSKSLTIVGGGSAGVELALSVRYRLGRDFPIEIVQRSSTLLPEAPKAVQEMFESYCRARDIRLKLNTEFDSQGLPEDVFVLWCTPARGPSFLSTSLLQRDDKGFLLTDATLRCLGQGNVFAVGDVAKIVGQERPRAGVFAVRLANPLRTNIERLVKGKSLKSVRLQKKGLALITRGDRFAVAVKGRFYLRGRWVWWIKNFIDESFMRKLRDF